MKSHRHSWAQDSYAMPCYPCERCGESCCVDCSTIRSGNRICDRCERLDELTAEERARRMR